MTEHATDVRQDDDRNPLENIEDWNLEFLTRIDPGSLLTTKTSDWESALVHADIETTVSEGPETRYDRVGGCLVGFRFDLSLDPEHEIIAKGACYEAAETRQGPGVYLDRAIAQATIRIRPASEKTAQAIREFIEIYA